MRLPREKKTARGKASPEKDKTGLVLASQERALLRLGSILAEIASNSTDGDHISTDVVEDSIFENRKHVKK